MNRTTIFFAVAIGVAMIAVRPAWSQEWSELRSAPGGFSILMPGKPIETSGQGETDYGRVTWRDYTVANQGPDREWVVGCIDFPKGFVQAHAAEKILDLRTAQIGKVFRISKETTFRSGTITGRELHLTDDTDGHMEHIMRFFVQGNRLYQLHIAARDTLPKSQEHQKFFSSFKLLPEGE